MGNIRIKRIQTNKSNRYLLGKNKPNLLGIYNSSPSHKENIVYPSKFKISLLTREVFWSFSKHRVTLVTMQKIMSTLAIFIMFYEFFNKPIWKAVSTIVASRWASRRPCPQIHGNKARSREFT